MKVNSYFFYDNDSSYSRTKYSQNKSGISIRILPTCPPTSICTRAPNPGYDVPWQPVTFSQIHHCGPCRPSDNPAEFLGRSDVVAAEVLYTVYDHVFSLFCDAFPSYNSPSDRPAVFGRAGSGRVPGVPHRLDDARRACVSFFPTACAWWMHQCVFVVGAVRCRLCVLHAARMCAKCANE